MNARVKFVSATIMHLMIFFFFLPIVITAAYIGLESVVPTTKLLPYPTNLVLSAMAFAVGWYWMIWSNFYLFKFGRGTSLEIAGKGVNQTQLLQTDGPYAYCRNPMAFGFVMAYVVGLGFFLHSLWAIALAIASDVGLRIYLGAWEEKGLERRFGDAYRAYRRETPPIFPRFWRLSVRRVS